MHAPNGADPLVGFRIGGRSREDVTMVEILDTHGLRPDPYDGARFGARSTCHTVTTFHRALRHGGIDVDYRLVWDLVDRQVVGFDAIPVVRDAAGNRSSAAELWSIAQRAGLVSDLVWSLRASVEAAQQTWIGLGLEVPVTIAQVPARFAGRAFARRSGRPLGRPTMSLDLDPTASHELFGLSPDRRWRVHVPAEHAVAEIRRVVGAGARPTVARLSAALVHRFPRDATQLALVARCIEAARHHGLVVQADGADDGESVNGLLVLGCHEASGDGLGADLRASEISTLRWVSPTLRWPSDRPLPAVAG
jgi:EAL domain-containing protein (putative c-di-GMP-specific phosphodiesterase class I)